MRLLCRLDAPGTVVYLLHRAGRFPTIKGKLLAQWNGFCWVSWDLSPNPETHPDFNLSTDAPEPVEPEAPLPLTPTEVTPYAEHTD